MKILKPKAEIKAMLSILQGSDEVKLELLNVLTPAHFGYTPMHAAYLVVTDMIQNSAMDLPQMETFLQHQDLTQDVVDILGSPTVSPIKHNADDAKRLCGILEYYRQVRSVYKHLSDQSLVLKNSTKVDIDELVQSMETTLMDVRSDAHEEKMYHAGRGASNSNEAVEEVFSTEKPRLIPSTFRNFDAKTGGFGANDLVILMSHMKGGKSIISMNVGVEQYLKHNLDVIYIPLEMNKEETMQRIISKISTVEHTKIRQKSWNPHELKTAKRAWRKFKKHGEDNNCRFTVWPIASLTIPQLKMRLRPMNYDVIILDYINLLVDPTNNQNEPQRLSNFARDLKLLTKELDSLVLVPTQMNMDGEVRYAKAIKEHANTVWSWMYGEEEAGTHVITVKQPAVRGWHPFPFQLREDFSRMHVADHTGGGMNDEDFAVVKNETMRGV